MQPDDQLIREILAGNRNAYASLVRRYERIVHAAAWAILRDHHAAQDITQDAFLNAYRHLASLRASRNFAPWLLTITRNAATDLARNKNRLVPVATIPDIASRDAPEHEDAVQMLSALAHLPDHDQQLLLLRYFQDFPVADIATLLSRPVGTITKQLSRAMAALRERLKEPS